MNVERQKHIFVWVICGLVLVAALAAGITWAVRRDRAMHAALRELQEWNQADTVFTSDSVARVLVDYFDHPWHSANDRMLAHYLLGRAHADMGEAPQAIEDYQTAVECADTTDQDCDFRLLRNVYGQMAEVFSRQNLWSLELKAYHHYCTYSERIGDTYEYARSYLLVSEILYALGDTVSAMQSINHARQIYINHQMLSEAAQIYAPAIHAAVNLQEFDKAWDMIDVYERESGLFDESGNIQQGREIYYYDKGVCYLSQQQMDSAEQMFRKLLLIPENSIDAYRGLLMLYRQKGEIDSTFKYATLYEDALAEYLNATQTEAVARAHAMYNYSRFQQLADEQKLRVTRIKFALCVLVILFIIAGAMAYLYFLQKKRKREREYQSLMTQYFNTKQELGITKEELTILRNHTESTNETDALLHDKEQRIHVLEEDLSKYQHVIQELKAADKESILKNSDIVRKLQKMTEVHTIRQGAKLSIVEKQTPTSDDWTLLKEMIHQCLPLFYAHLSGHLLTEQEWKTSMLLRIGFKTNDVALLLDTRPSRVSKLKILINKKLFNEERSESLMKNMRSL